MSGLKFITAYRYRKIKATDPVFDDIRDIQLEIVDKSNKTTHVPFGSISEFAYDTTTYEWNVMLVGRQRELCGILNNVDQQELVRKCAVNTFKK
jgi:hypothetical protein